MVEVDGEGATFAKKKKKMVICSQLVSQSHHLPTVGLWASPFTALCLSFLICIVEVLMALISLSYDCGSQLGVNSAPRKHLAMPGNIFGCYR